MVKREKNTHLASNRGHISNNINNKVMNLYYFLHLNWLLKHFHKKPVKKRNNRPKM